MSVDNKELWVEDENQSVAYKPKHDTLKGMTIQTKCAFTTSLTGEGGLRSYSPRL